MVIIDNTEYTTEEEKRLREDRHREKYWKKWGPYVAERQWATVREDYSDNGDAWSRKSPQARYRTRLTSHRFLTRHVEKASLPLV